MPPPSEKLVIFLNDIFEMGLLTHLKTISYKKH